MEKLVIFDFDDTLVHLNVDWESVTRECEEIVRKDKLDLNTREYLAIVANKISDTETRKKEVDEIFKKYEEKVWKNKDYIVFNEMIELVKALYKEKYTLAIASGNCTVTIKEVLQQLNILDRFTLIVGRDVVRYNKPEPDSLGLIISKLKPTKVVMIGDSFVDQEAAKKTNIDFIKVDISKPNEVQRVKKEIEAKLR